MEKFMSDLNVAKGTKPLCLKQVFNWLLDVPAVNTVFNNYKAPPWAQKELKTVSEERL
jgi:hypothetical protein